MRNCLILGSGRSGSSLAAATLAASGWHPGDDLIPENPQNPRGFYESRTVNELNEQMILALQPPVRLAGLAASRMKRNRLRMRSWVVDLPARARAPFYAPMLLPGDWKDRARGLQAKTPWCLKDPRFSWTLPFWRPILKNVTFVCVFRSPAETISSTRRFFHDMYRMELQNGEMARAWLATYRAIVNVHALHGDWMFLHYRQFFTGEAQKRLSEALGGAVTAELAEDELHRSRRNGRVAELGNEHRQLYEGLCQRAGLTSPPDHFDGSKAA